MQDDTGIVLQPKITTAKVSESEAVAALDIRSRELRQGRQLVDLACSTDRRCADATDTEASDGERIGVPPIKKGTVAATATGKIGHLDLFHINCSVSCEPRNRFRPDLN